MSTSQDRDNPFAPPTAAVLEPAGNEAGQYIPGGRKVPAARGVAWFGEGWEIFKRAPGTWILIFIVFVLLSIVLAVVPLGSLVSSVIYPAFTAGFMIGCKALEEGGTLEVGHLFAGFRKNVGSLMLVGVLYLVGMMLIGVLAGIGAALLIPALTSKGMDAGDFSTLMIMLPLIALIALVVMAAMLPLMMALWFAPALVVFHDAQPMDAMRSSFQGSLKNIGAFTLYGLVGLALALAAALPFGLGFLVFGPLIWCTIYTGYRDIFLQRE
jgi:uncharacterized membrane protein